MTSALNIIAHNLPSMYTSRQLNLTGKDKAGSAEKLGSGYRINRAADDAAGLSISEKMRRQIRGLSQASDNCEDGISYCQTADGALNEVSAMISRMKELSVQAANGINSASDRVSINDEIQEIKKEMDKILSTTKFNEQKIWPNEGQYFTEMEPAWVTVPVLLPSTKTVTAFSVTNSYSSTGVITNDNKAVWLRSSFNISADENGMKVSWTGYNGNTYTSDLMEWKDGNSCSYKLSDYLSAYSGQPEMAGVSFTISYNKNDFTEVSDLINYYNGKKIYASPSTNVSMELYGSDSAKLTGDSVPRVTSVSLNYPAVVKSGMNLDDSGDASVKPGPSIHSDTSFIEPTGSKNTNLIQEPTADSSGNLNGTWKFSFDMKNIGTVTATCTQISYTLSTGGAGNDSDPNRFTKDLKNSTTLSNDRWWYYSKYVNPTTHKTTYPTYGASYTASGTGGAGFMDALYGNANRPGLKTGDFDHDGSDPGTIVMNFSLVAQNPFKIENSSQSDTQVGSFTIQVPMNESESISTITERILKIAGADIYSGSANSDTGGTTGSNSMYISVGNSSPSKSVPTTVPGTEQVWGEKEVLDENGRIVRKWSPWKNSITIHALDESNTMGKIGIVHQNMTLNTLGLEQTNVLTIEDADKAIDEVESAGKMIDRERALFGAYQNRLEHTVKNLDNTVENTTAAESLIRDTDMAKEMVRYSGRNILEQAGQSMLTQACHSNEGVLSLLK